MPIVTPLYDLRFTQAVVYGSRDLCEGVQALKERRRPTFPWAVAGVAVLF